MSFYERLAEIERSGTPAALATIIQARGAVPRHAGSKMIVYADGRIEGTVGGGEMESRVVREALEILQTGEPRRLHYTFSDPSDGDPGVCGGEIDVFVEPLTQPPTLIVVGAGHVGKAVVHLGHWLGFRVVVSDDRPEFATAEAVPGADAYVACALAELPARSRIDARTYVVLTTRGVDVDVAGLPALLESPAAYIGIIGSRRRWETSVQELQAQGVPDTMLGRIHSPIGLELNAETPEEIAVSILAEIILQRRGGTGESMRHAPVGRRGSSRG